MRDEGLVAEFACPVTLHRAVLRLHEEGFRSLEAFTPYPVEAVNRVLGPRPSAVTRVAGTAAAAGVVFGYGLQWLLNAVLYPLDVGGRPPHSVPPFIPITFETGVLFTGLATFFAVFALSGLPRLWRPIFEIDGFERATLDRFFLLVPSANARFDWRDTATLLRELSAMRVQHCGGRGT